MAISNSIVDYLNSAGQDSSYKARKRLAEQQGISNYTGSARQNTSLLNSLRNAAASSSGSGPSKNVLAGVGDTPATALNLTGAAQSPTVNAASQQTTQSAYGMAGANNYPTNYKASEKTSAA